MPPESVDPFIQFRRELHQFPEISGQEYATQQRIKSFVSSFCPAKITEVGKTGLLLQYGEDSSGPTTLIRADMDALPIQEINEFGYKSRNGGVSHKCGHDGHTATLTRLASLLHKKPPATGVVYLLFQPAEETGAGAEAVLNDPAFASVHPDRVYALHNLPGYPQGAIVCKPGNFTAAVKSLIVRFFGKVSHSAEPENGINPAYLMAEFILKSRDFEHNDPDSEAFALITPVYTTLGEQSYGISAGYGEVHLTLRTRNNDRMEALTHLLLTTLSNLSAGSGITLETAYTEAFFANQNDTKAYEAVKNCAEQLGYAFVEKQEPFKWGEDFGLFTQQYKGAMFGIGAGQDTPALHNADYDFNDHLIEPGAQLFAALIDQYHT
ncbi:amidohydrolase [Spirosoma sp. SC4-14]|uniref:amidohydrolase n=1 Tax=Spirosoma sp. SC4-14 TaxID=3128900 RepID=UPI0030CE7260